MNKTIEAYPKAGKICKTEPIWQWDVGDKIHLNDIDLPPSYKAEFSNVAVRGTAKPRIQTTDTIEIPPEYQESGEPVYTWIVLVDESSRQTECIIITPVSGRSKPTDEEPIPAEQTEIEQTLSALNQAVSNVQEIADAIPDTINDALEAAKESGEFDGKDGYTPVKDVDYFDGKDGIDGKDGKDGKDGADGYTPQKGIDYFDGKDGKDGKDGADGQTGPAGTDGVTFTPTVSAEGVISWINDGGLPNPEPRNIMGPPGTGIDVHICAAGEYSTETRKPTILSPATNTFYLVPAENAASPDMFVEWIFTNGDWEMFGSATVEVPVQDVQVNGVSVLQDGVANVPLADNSTPGVVRGRTDRGITIVNNWAQIVPPNEGEIKTSSGSYRPIVPNSQHIATFYGLAKAAGDTTQSASSNAVGNYTDEAKSAIQTMLGLSAIIGAIEGATASKPYSIGQSFLHGGALYKVTAAIAANDAIVPGTNCDQTTIIDLIMGV